MRPLSWGGGTNGKDPIFTQDFSYWKKSESVRIFEFVLAPLAYNMWMKIGKSIATYVRRKKSNITWLEVTESDWLLGYILFCPPPPPSLGQSRIDPKSQSLSVTFCPKLEGGGGGKQNRSNFCLLSSKWKQIVSGRKETWKNLNRSHFCSGWKEESVHGGTDHSRGVQAALFYWQIDWPIRTRSAVMVKFTSTNDPHLFGNKSYYCITYYRNRRGLFVYYLYIKSRIYSVSPSPPVFFTPPVTIYMLLYSTLLCKKK